MRCKFCIFKIAQRYNADPFNFTPVSILISLSPHHLTKDITAFQSLFEIVKSQTGGNLDFKQMLNERSPLQSESINLDLMLMNKFCQKLRKMPETFHNEGNLWVVKNTNATDTIYPSKNFKQANRYNSEQFGRRIEVFNDFLQFMKFVMNEKEMIINDTSKRILRSYVMDNQNPGGNKGHIVVQKYLERPLLINGKKFNVQTWGLIDHDMKFYCFKEGFVKVGEESFSLENLDPKIHLSNLNVKSGEDNTNIWSFEQFKVIIIIIWFLFMMFISNILKFYIFL